MMLTKSNTQIRKCPSTLIRGLATGILLLVFSAAAQAETFAKKFCVSGASDDVVFDFRIKALVGGDFCTINGAPAVDPNNGVLDCVEFATTFVNEIRNFCGAPGPWAVRDSWHDCCFTITWDRDFKVEVWDPDLGNYCEVTGNKDGCHFNPLIQHALGFGSDTIWGIDNGADLLGTFTSTEPGVFNPIGPTGILTGFVNSLEYDGRDRLFASDGESLFAIDPTTGAGTLIGTHGITNGESMGDFAYAADSGTMYGIATLCSIQSSIYTIDLATGAATFVCTLDPLGGCDVGLTFDSAGRLLGLDLVTDTLYTLDLTTCAMSAVVSLPYNANYGQGFAANDTTGDNYHVAFNATTFQGELYSFNSSGDYLFLGVLGPTQIAAAAVRPDAVADCLTMTMTPLQAGGQTTWVVGGAEDGMQVTIVYGFQPGLTSLQGLFNYCATFGIKGVSQNKIICRKNADGLGEISCRRTIPNGAKGRTVLMQAAQQGTCPDECVSNLLEAIVQ